MNVLAELEAAEYRAVDAVRRLTLHDPRRAAIQALLAKARTAKASLLAGGDAIRKIGARRIEFGKAGNDRERQGEELAPIAMLKDSLAAQRRREAADPGSGTEHRRLCDWLIARAGR